MTKAKPHKTIKTEGAKKRVAIIDYDSTFTKGIEQRIKEYNERNPGDNYEINTYKASELENLADVGKVDKVIHTGGTGRPVRGAASGDKLYICHSHQKKAEIEGGKVERLADYQKGIGYMDVKEDDPIIGERGKTRIDKYHTLAVTKAPKNAKVIATSKQTLKDGNEVETAEALRYKDGSITVQGHPGGGTASYIVHNFLKGDKYYKKAA